MSCGTQSRTALFPSSAAEPEPPASQLYLAIAYQSLAPTRPEKPNDLQQAPEARKLEFFDPVTQGCVIRRFVAIAATAAPPE